MKENIKRIFACIVFWGLLGVLYASPGLPNQPGKESLQWPFQEFAYAKVFLYNLDNNLYGQHAIIKEGKLDPTVIGDGVMLSKEQVKKVLSLTNKDIAGLLLGLSKSHIPHHGIVFFNSEHHPVAFITICFDCESLRVSPEIKFKEITEELPEPEIKRLLLILEEYKKIVSESGLPIFDNPFQYQEYGKNIKGKS